MQNHNTCHCPLNKIKIGIPTQTKPNDFGRPLCNIVINGAAPPHPRLRNIWTAPNNKSNSPHFAFPHKAHCQSGWGKAKLCPASALPQQVSFFFIWNWIVYKCLILSEPTLLMWPWWVKIPSDDFTDETLLMVMLEGLMVVVDMDVDKVAPPGGQICN